MLWRDGETESKRTWFTHRQRRWWDWVDGLCEPPASSTTVDPPDDAP